MITIEIQVVLHLAPQPCWIEYILCLITIFSEEPHFTKISLVLSFVTDDFILVSKDVADITKLWI